MDATFMLSEQASMFVPSTVAGPCAIRHRYRISFADGSIGTRYYVEPLTVGQRIVDHRTRSHVISRIDREPEGSVGRASAVQSPS